MRTTMPGFGRAKEVPVCTRARRVIAAITPLLPVLVLVLGVMGDGAKRWH